jgi:hypothetical protein
LLLAFGSIAAGCGDDAHPAHAGAVQIHPVPGCESIDPTPCDVFDTACETRLMDLAACLRGSAAQPLPPVSRMTEAEYAQWLTDQIAAEKPPPNVNNVEAAFVMLGLVVQGAFQPSSMAMVDASQVWGVYRSDTDDVLLIDHGVPGDAAQVNAVLLHEFVHALQDHDQDLPTWFDAHADTYDATLATKSVVEGEARFHEDRFAVSLLGLDPATVDLAKHFDNAILHDEEWMRMQPSPYLASFYALPYDFGARRLLPRFTQNGPQAIADLFATPTADTRVLLDPTNDAVIPAWAAPSAPTPPAEWTLVEESTLGAWMVDLVLGEDGLTADADVQARGWRGDRFWIYAGTGASATATAMVWRIAFADEATALLAATRLSLKFVTQRFGAEVVIAAADPRTLLDWAFVAPAQNAASPGDDQRAFAEAASVSDWVARIFIRAERRGR